MINQKAQQREQLIMEFGILIQPFVDLTAKSSPPEISDYRIARAKVQAGDSQWRLIAKDYCTFADDVFMHEEYQKISHVNERFISFISPHIDGLKGSRTLASLQSLCESALSKLRENFIKYISEVSVNWEPEIFAANTPFTAYLRIKDSLSSVNERLHYFDRYLKVEFYEIFLRNIDRNIEIRLVTTSGNSNYGVSSVRAVSDIVKQEFTNYQLIEVSPNDLHDRNLRVDDSVFNLGPGIDRAGIALTNFNPADNSTEALVAFDAIIGTGNIIHTS
ncbi:hypothetical protein ACFL6P_07985 [Candidatus Latescibacterota bacterium]